MEQRTRGGAGKGVTSAGATSRNGLAAVWRSTPCAPTLLAVAVPGRCEARQRPRGQAPLTVTETRALVRMESDRGRVEEPRLDRPPSRGWGAAVATVAVVLVLLAVLAVDGPGWPALGVMALALTTAAFAWLQDSPGPRGR